MTNQILMRLCQLQQRQETKKSNFISCPRALMTSAKLYSCCWEGSRLVILINKSGPGRSKPAMQSARQQGSLAASNCLSTMEEFYEECRPIKNSGASQVEPEWQPGKIKYVPHSNRIETISGESEILLLLCFNHCLNCFKRTFNWSTRFEILSGPLVIFHFVITLKQSVKLFGRENQNLHHWWSKMPKVNTLNTTGQHYNAKYNTRPW